MLNTSEFAQKLVGAAVGRIALQDFEAWLVSRSWNVHEWGTPELKDAVYALELELGEVSNGHRDATHLRVFCADLASQLETTDSQVSPISTSGLGRQISSLDIIGHAISADSLRAAA